MECSPTTEHPGRVLRLHALAWLAFANLAGLACALLLLAPAGPGLSWLFNYGRLVAVHANVQLYGWCALPLAGLLLAWFGHAGESGLRGTRLVCVAWSLALAVGVASWLGGSMSGKPFMEWTRVPAAGMALAMLVFWVVLANGTESGAWRGAALAWRLLVLLALLLVPFAFFLAADPSLYPSVNPHSGGATGTSLLRSTLGIVLIYGLLPVFLGLRRRPAARPWLVRGFWTLYAAACCVAALAAEGHVSNREFAQVWQLGSLVLWVPALWMLLAAHEWPSASRSWLAWGLGWGGLLVSSGWLSFLPAVLDRFKFTHLLVAHAHLAMAGLVSCVAWAILHALDSGAALRPATRLAWNLGLLLMLAALVGIAHIETSSPGALWSSHPLLRSFLWLRLLAGGVMSAASFVWLRDALVAARLARRSPVPSSAVHRLSS